MSGAKQTGGWRAVVAWGYSSDVPEIEPRLGGCGLT